VTKAVLETNVCAAGMHSVSNIRPGPQALVFSAPYS